MAHSHDRLEHSLKTGPSFPSRKTPWIPALVIVAGALIAFFAWTLPNWDVFAQNVSRFSTLWQIAANRRVIVTLVIKVCSPVLIGGLLSACSWLWYLITPFLQPSLSPTQVPEIQPSPVSSMRRGLIPISPTTSNERRPLSDPITPLPPPLKWMQESGQEAEVLTQPKMTEEEESKVSSIEQHDENPHFYVSITLLKKVSMTITAQGISREVPLLLNAKRVQLLAYVAWVRGQRVNRDRLLEQVFGHGRDDEDATREKLGDAFDSHKKLIRGNLREIVSQMNKEAGREVIPLDLDIFSHQQRLYWLSEVCRVVDLEEIEQQHTLIEQARKDGRLVNDVPEEVKAACDHLIAAYSGDFLQELVTEYLDDFEPWASSWARKPYTIFRDYYLQALWYAAEYELHLGQRFSGESMGEDALRTREQRTHWELAAQYFRTYAMTACNSRFDTKVTFAGNGREQGERVIMSERALRRSLVLYGSIGETHQVDQVYTAYYKQMRSISAKVWEPSTTTRTDLQSAKEQTNAYRFSMQVTPPESLSTVETSR